VYTVVNTTTTALSATTYGEMAGAATTHKGTTRPTYVTKQGGKSSVLTTVEVTSSPQKKGTTALVASRGTSPHATVQHGSSALTTTELSLTDDQNIHHNLVLIAGANISLRCSSSVDVTTFRWRYCPLDCSRPIPVYNGLIVNTHGTFDNAARVTVTDCDDKKCTFNVKDLHLADAGSFTCKLPKDDKSWSLTILGK